MSILHSKFIDRPSTTTTAQPHPPDPNSGSGTKPDDKFNVAPPVVLPDSFPGEPPRKKITREEARQLLVHRVTPEYPLLAREQGIRGTVVTLINVDGSGNVINAKAVAGHPLLLEAAEQTIKQWKYKPYVANGKVVERWGSRVDLKFPPE